MSRLEFTADILAPIEKVWAFYDSLEGLVRITPPQTRVKIVNPPQKLEEGARFTMLVRQPPLFFPVAWECYITAHQPLYLFVDEQGRGPFTQWRHEHYFDPLPSGGTRLRDKITYVVPFGPLGVIADCLFIRPMLTRMFEYRYAATRRALE